jgi:trans-aconitate 2-methyltransferase
MGLREGECTLNDRMSDWNAAQYHRLSDPQRGWGIRVLDRLQPCAGERVLDIGCGTGRLTAEIAARAQRSEVIATDVSASMLEQARAYYGGIARFTRANGMHLPFVDGSFDAVFSTATFHWIPDHEQLFGEIYRVLKPGGRLVSQCGGGPNLQQLYRRAQRQRGESPYREFFEGWGDPCKFASPEDTAARLARAGFADIQVSLEPAQTPFATADDYEEFITTVCMRHHLDRLPPALRQPFVHELALEAMEDDPPLTLDYWRLNADARK